MVKVSASTLKATCLALIDRVHTTGEPVLITKRGKVLAKLVPEVETERKPWLSLRGKGSFEGDVVAPVMSDAEMKKLGY